MVLEVTTPAFGKEEDAARPEGSIIETTGHGIRELIMVGQLRDRTSYGWDKVAQSQQCALRQLLEIDLRVGLGKGNGSGVGCMSATVTFSEASFQLVPL